MIADTFRVTSPLLKSNAHSLTLLLDLGAPFAPRRQRYIMQAITVGCTVSVPYTDQLRARPGLLIPARQVEIETKIGWVNKSHHRRSRAPGW
jgi:hypothetical protein